MKIPLLTTKWAPAWRIIPSCFPTIHLFESVADPADLEAVLALESLTNDRVRDAVGNLRLVAEAERISGPGTSVIMAAFTHLNPEGSRFSNGKFGVFYAAKALETAVKETCYHRERFLRYTDEPALELDMRVYHVDLKGSLHDIRSLTSTEVYHPENYSHSQELGHRLRTEGAGGIVYCSVRDAGGTNAAIFRPKLLSNARQERHLCYVWDGRRISLVYEKRLFM